MYDLNEEDQAGCLAEASGRSSEPPSLPSWIEEKVRKGSNAESGRPTLETRLMNSFCSSVTVKCDVPMTLSKADWTAQDSSSRFGVGCVDGMACVFEVEVEAVFLFLLRLGLGGGGGG